MKFARKMLLLDYDSTNINNGQVIEIPVKNISNSEGIVDQNQNPVAVTNTDPKLAEIDTLIASVLNNSELSAYEKITYYHDLLRRYMLQVDQTAQARQNNHLAILDELANAVFKKVQKNPGSEQKVKKQKDKIESPTVGGLPITSRSKLKISAQKSVKKRPSPYPLKKGFRGFENESVQAIGAWSHPEIQKYFTPSSTSFTSTPVNKTDKVIRNFRKAQENIEESSSSDSDTAKINNSKIGNLTGNSIKLWEKMF